MKKSDGQGDHAWGWVITAAVFGSNCLSAGYFRAFGVFFVEIIDTFHSSSSLTSLVMGVQAGVLSISALAVHSVLLPLVGERGPAVVGGLLMATGMAMATFATSVPFLIFSISVLVGLGNAMCYGPGLVLLGQYFERRRALAMAVAHTGSGVGTMTLPLLATYLLQHYGLSGAWLLYGAVNLHLCVFASLFRPLQPASLSGKEGPKNDAESSHVLLQGKDQDGDSEDGDYEATNIDNITEHNGQTVHLESSKLEDIAYLTDEKGLQTEVSLKEASRNTCSDKQEQNGMYPVTQRHLAYLREGNNAKLFHSAEDISDNPISGRPLHGKRSSTLGDLRFPSSHHSNTSVNMSTVLQRNLIKDAAIHSSHPHLLVISSSLDSLSQDLRRDSLTAKGSEEPRQSCGGFWTNVACDGDLLRKPLFWLVQAYVCVGLLGATGAGFYLPALCQEQGLSKEDTAMVLLIAGALNLAGRFLCGVVADRQWLRPSHISAIAFLIIGLLFQVLPLLPASLGSMVTLGVVYGVFQGAYFTMLPLIIIDFVSLPHFSRTFGFVQLFQGAFATMVYPLLGRLRDVTGNYYATFHCLGACALLASLLLLLESGARALRKTRSSKDLAPSDNL